METAMLDMPHVVERPPGAARPHVNGRAWSAPELFHNGFPFHAEMEPSYIYRLGFLSTVEGSHTLCVTARFGIDLGGLEFLDTVAEVVAAVCKDTPDVIGVYPSHHIVQVHNQVQVHVLFQNQKELTSDSTRGHFSIEIAGLRDLVLDINSQLQERFGKGRLATIKWWFNQGPHTTYRQIVMEPPPPVRDEFYPFLGEPVESFIDRYLASDASVLFMMGDPGTGKTSLVRHMVYSRRLNATITYDEELMTRDGIFVDFITNDDDGFLIIEDADTMLGSRESEGNKLISRFLNVSDGLVKLKNKKMIFTTNMGDFSKVDTALIRPGRCFGALKFRPLTATEAREAAKAADLPDPGKSVTLAELFNASVMTPEIRAIGF